MRNSIIFSVLENQPLIKDVRDGVIYGIANNYQGTLKVANPATILKGVPTDDTVGEWAFDTDLIERLKHCATTEIVDVQLASYQNIIKTKKMRNIAEYTDTE